MKTEQEIKKEIKRIRMAKQKMRAQSPDYSNDEMFRSINSRMWTLMWVLEIEDPKEI